MAASGWKGDIGSNISFSKEEREEDVLEQMYVNWHRGETYTLRELSSQLDLSRRDLTQVLRRMLEHGYITREGEAFDPVLTSLGRAQGAECLYRHQNLTRFLQMTCGVNEQVAEENACRIEHIVSDELIAGINRYMKSGRNFEHTVHKCNLRMIYEEGTYEFAMGIYRAEERYPRILADESAYFSSEIRLEVNDERSFIYIKKRSDAFPKKLWYRVEAEWKPAQEKAAGYQLPTEIFSFSQLSDSFLTEGFTIIAFAEDEEIRNQDCRELNIHLW